VLGLADVPDAPLTGAGVHQPYTENHIGDLVIDGFEHLLEHLVALLFVFYFGVSFGVSTQHNALFEPVHRIQMVLPGRIVNLQKDIFFQFGQFLTQELPCGRQQFALGLFPVGQFLRLEGGAEPFGGLLSQLFG